MSSVRTVAPATVRVRAADPRRDRERIGTVLARNLPPAAGADRYDWLYLDNPAGPARVWVAEDAATGEVIGTSAGHPKRMYCEGQIETVLDLSDFAIDAPYRTLGPALALLRATLAPVGAGEYAFSYDHPTDPMLAIYRRMGRRDLAPQRRWVRPLRASAVLARRFGCGPVWEAAGPLVDTALRVCDAVRRPARRAAIDVRPLAGDPGAEFDRLDADLARMTPFRLQRSADYLRWRYVRNVVAPHEVLCARRGGQLVGYAVSRPGRDGVVSLVDVFTLPEPQIATRLINDVVERARARGATAVWATVLAGCPAEAALPDAGFVAREDGPGIVVYAPRATSERAARLQDPRHWRMLEGDRDV
jgi:hypothetical protein